MNLKQRRNNEVSNPQIDELNKKMDMIMRLIIVQTFRNTPKYETIDILTQHGFTQGEISVLLKTSVESVKSARKYMKRKSN